MANNFFALVLSVAPSHNAIEPVVMLTSQALPNSFQHSAHLLMIVYHRLREKARWQIAQKIQSEICVGWLF
jgi:hypothetical protein